MKKSLVLAMAMALGVTASAYAANPFSDVPAGHWAYDSVSKLAAAGIVQGYGDTTFGGDKLMTRYEMAEIVAKALAKGANVDKLAAEFADELNALGVRVAKLEKKADNVKITGRFRAQSKGFHGDNAIVGPKGIKNRKSNSWSRLRSDITLKGAINEDWTYTALLRNEQRLDKGRKQIGEEGIDVKNAYVSGKVGGLKVTAGHYFEYLADGFIYDWTADGVVASYGTKKLNVTGGYAQLNDGMTDIAYGIANAALGKVAKVTVGYYNLDGANVYDSRDLVSAKLALNLGKNLTAAYTYIHSDEKDANGGNRAHNIAVNYKGANKAKPGTFGLEAIHYDQDAASYIVDYHTADGWIPAAAFKGWKVGAGYTMAKNVLLNVAWYDLKEKGGDQHTGTLFTDLNFYF